MRVSTNNVNQTLLRRTVTVPTSPSKQRRGTMIQNRKIIFAALACGTVICFMFGLFAGLSREPDGNDESEATSPQLLPVEKVSRRRKLRNASRIASQLAKHMSSEEKVEAATLLGEKLVVFASPPPPVVALASEAAIMPPPPPLPSATSCIPIGGGPPIAVPHNWVDDDFCDCADGSDEPRTSACAGSVATHRFICERDVVDRGHPKRSIPLSHVADGVCDCCDGSDEARGLSLVAATAHHCPNRCADLERAAAAREHTRQEGLKARAAYAARGQAKNGVSIAARTSPHVAYRALDGECFHSGTAEYTYDVCLYKSASQRPTRSGGPVDLGKHWEWRPRTSHDEPVTGVLKGGARCFGAGVDRSLVVSFVCASEREARLGKVTEASTCVYAVTLHTPAACE